MRYAIVSGDFDRDRVAKYLPKNYSIVHQDPNAQGLLIAGEDDHGWTMDEYVIPRLGSGLIPCYEVWPVFTNNTVPLLAMDVPLDWLRMPHRSAS